MRTPLYQLPERVVPERTGDGHHGLWYDKFCNVWSREWQLKTAGNDENPKLTWIKSVAGRVGSDQALSEFTQRMFDLVTKRGGAAVVATAQSRFVTGLGRSHPVENGFAWHPTLGVPYLPGSSLKGLTRAWAQSKYSKDEVDQLLGKPGHTSGVAFLDAVPIRSVELEPDVLTPHYANWSENDLPGDWRSPTPVPFLVAARGLSMLVGMVPLTKSHGEQVEMAWKWLTSALEEFGAGAKTALGYGEFRAERDHSFLQNLEKKRREREAMATPEGRWRHRLRGRSEDELLEAVLDHLIKTPLPDPEERRAFAKVILEKGMVSAWRKGVPHDPQRTRAQSKKKLKERAKAVQAAVEELDAEPPS